MDGVGEESAVSDCSSSGEEDGNDEWKAAINSVVGGGAFGNGGSIASLSGPSSASAIPVGGHDRAQPQPLKHFQIKGQKELFEKVQNTLVFVREDTEPEPSTGEEENSFPNEGGIRLFQSAPVGIELDIHDEPQGPKKKPRLVPGDEVDEKSKKFKRRLQSVLVEGNDVLAAAEETQRKIQARREAREEAKREAAKREEQRVMELKKIRGERWLPSIAKEMQRKKTQVK